MSLAFEFTEEPEDVEVETNPRPLHRTRPRFPTTHSVDGRDWNTFFKDLKAQSASDPEEEEDPEEIEVIERGYDLQEPLRAPGKAGTLARRLSTAGWTVRVQRSLARVPAVLYKHNSKDGEHFTGDILYEGYEIETLILLGVKRAGGRMMAVEASWDSKNGFLSATTHDPIMGRQRMTSVMKPRKQYDWEKEEGIAGTMGLDQWLWISCPHPCHFCGEPGPSQVNVIPIERGGADASWNVLPACTACRAQKSMAIDEAHCSKCADVVQKHRDIRSAEEAGVTLAAYLKTKVKEAA